MKYVPIVVDFVEQEDYYINIHASFCYTCNTCSYNDWKTIFYVTAVKFVESISEPLKSDMQIVHSIRNC